MASWCVPCKEGSDKPFVPEASTDLPRVLQYLSVLEGRGARGLAVAVSLAVVDLARRLDLLHGLPPVRGRRPVENWVEQL